ncbi:hypothetical protein KZZ52_37765 [Dactylosporangium sp. AC04546]|uniref:hypothetical protein n=1 Tax=Dactylosporangium sp. AC04546 TaxID=2862460 RepID=UPI001EDEEC4A|nr:hypothetical protein [Dactylosporangium sp. AC04546]WVK79710.1 hypothetical protein KZZ52_37765 [Dactylosporangium sp. AC04546]
MTTIARPAGLLLLSSAGALLAGAVVAVAAGLTLNPSDLPATLGAVAERTELHLAALALDVAGWLALLAAALTMAGPSTAVAAGLLAAAGLAGLLHDAGNLAVTQLTAVPAAAVAVLLVAKWMVNLAGLLWVAATVALSRGLSRAFRGTGAVAAASGLAAVAVPWTSGTAGPSVALEQVGYALHLPVMVWFAAVGLVSVTPVRRSERSQSRR